MIDDTDNLNRYLGNINGTWNISKSLNYKATFGFDRSDGKRETWLGNTLLGYTGSENFRGINVPGVSGNGRGVVQNLELRSTLIEHTLNYDNKFGNHGITLLGGYSYQEFKNFGYNDIAWGTQNSNSGLLKSLNAFENRLPSSFGDSTKSELQSYFARSIYNYNDKYILTLTFRADGSSKFGENNKYGYFPAAAVRWRISNENFAPKKVFDDLSLRLNWGITGNQEFPAYASLAITQRQLDGSNSIISNASPDLKWETQTTYGAGVDFSILGGRVGGSLDYFNKSTKDLLFLQEYPAPSASSRRWINLPGKVVNKGVELGLTIGAVQKNRFNWEVIYNATFLDNTVQGFGS
ncbi:MAG TPA: TonB-dependent receptor, partial [Bacillota bacterium]|nr:TonB-dependent receptor [Bacillota bacterium]